MYPVYPSPNHVSSKSNSRSRPNDSNGYYPTKYSDHNGFSYDNSSPQTLYRPRFIASDRSSKPLHYNPNQAQLPHYEQPRYHHAGPESFKPRYDSQPHTSRYGVPSGPRHIQAPSNYHHFTTRPSRPINHRRFVRPSTPQDSFTPNRRQNYKKFHKSSSKPHQNKYFQGGLLYIIRGAPGSGKSTLARQLQQGRRGVILSTDDYFMMPRGYCFNPSDLPAAHEWNQNKADDCLRKGMSPVIIDNTNLESWEMKPYMLMALDYGYTIEIVEPDTDWKFDAAELARRNTHNVTKPSIEKMLARYEKNVTVESVLGRHLYRQYQEKCLGSSSVAANQDAEQLSSMMGSLSISRGRGSPFSRGRGSPSSSQYRSSSSRRGNYYS